MTRFKGFYFILDTALLAGNLDSLVKAALGAGVKIIQYRNKNAPTKEICDDITAIKKIIKNKNVLLLINDRADIAFLCGADGAHLGKKDASYEAARKILGKKKIIGLTVRSLKEAKQAQEMGADYVGLGPVFISKTKPGLKKPLGIKLIGRIRKELRIPIVAIGGINLNNARAVLATGADCICAVAALSGGKSLTEEINKFQKLFSCH
ncbi:MAG: thiamine phosphate synthase [Candidatus Omnitrophica bacterium]|nr:thiamine phosphate synthase [Candidatus Omnitrophota bacterium]MBU1924387.1 thiamine phosphate synthase [Candidatus Omnitrophota bacterium]